MSSFEPRTIARGAFQPQPQAPLGVGAHGLNRDSSDEEDEEAQQLDNEQEINFEDNPTLKDFLNLSNGGSRFIKATADARRAALDQNNNSSNSAVNQAASSTTGKLQKFV